MGEQLRPRLGGLRELCFQHVGDPAMKLLALSLTSAPTRRPRARVLEDITAAGGRPFADRIRLNQPANPRCSVDSSRSATATYLVTEFAAQRRGELGKPRSTSTRSNRAITRS